MGRQGRREGRDERAGETLRRLAFLVGCAVYTLCVAGILPARAEGVPPSEDAVCTASDLREQTLMAVRDCMARSPAPWPEQWQQEYVSTIRETISPRQDAPHCAKRLQILQKGFGPYWQRLRKNRERSLFEVHQAEIRWYVEQLMSTGLPCEEEKQRLRDQYRDLVEHAAQDLLAQLSFLDPDLVQKAKADHLADCHRNLDAPLLPIFLIPFSESQMDQIKQRWHDLRYARVDLWRQLGGTTRTSTESQADAAVAAHPDYLLTRRSLDQLQGQIWAVVARVPEYYDKAVANEIDTQRRRVQAMTAARSQEMRLPLAVVQTEYLSFLLAALLETPACLQSSDVRER